MNTGNFPLIALFAFVGIAVLTPVISFVFLKRKRDSIAEFPSRRPLASIFLTEILLWIAAVLVAGFMLVMLLGMFVYINAHAGATGSEAVSIAPLLIVFGMLAGLSLFGLWLHSHTVGKLWRST